MSEKKQKVYECTINKVLFAAIQLKRKNQDAKDIVERTGFSRPKVDIALNYGYIKDFALEVAIVDYYKERDEWEEKQAKILLNKLIKKQNGFRF